MAEPEFRWTQDGWDGADPSASVRSQLRAFLARDNWLVRAVIVLLSLGVFELTTNAAVSTAVSCLEFGRTDFQTAWWLRRTDPNPRRSSICSRCYLAWGFCRVSLVALLVIILIVCLDIALRPAGQGPIEPPPHVVGAFGLIAFALTLASALSFTVIVSAIGNRTKIWLGPEPRWAKQHGVWPPSAAPKPRRDANKAKVIFYLGCCFVMFPTLVGAVFACFLSPLKDFPWVFLAIVLAILVGVAVVIWLLERRVLASTPAECWPLDEPVPVPLF